jgi:hypothetical protein
MTAFISTDMPLPENEQDKRVELAFQVSNKLGVCSGDELMLLLHFEEYGLASMIEEAHRWKLNDNRALLAIQEEIAKNLAP